MQLTTPQIEYTLTLTGRELRLIGLCLGFKKMRSSDRAAAKELNLKILEARERAASDHLTNVAGALRTAKEELATEGGAEHTPEDDDAPEGAEEAGNA